MAGLGLPFLITMATSAYMVLFPPDEGKTDGSSSRCLSPSTSFATSGSRIANNPFWLGVGVGVILSRVASYEIKRRRFWQRTRLKFLSWLYDGVSSATATGGEPKTRQTPLLQKLRKPSLISELNGNPLVRRSESDENKDNSVCGQHVELVSPDWALSSDLYCDIVRLPSGTELMSKNAPGVEFYYVLEGNGQYVDQNGEKHQISAGFGFIVDPEWYV